jgi:hypothetical protein
MPDDPTPEPEPTPKSKTKAKPAPEPLTADDVAELLKAHGGDQGAAIRAVMAERDKFRDEATELKARIPKEGSVVLDQAQAALWAAYQAHGTPEAIAKALEAGTAATAERDELKFQSHIGEVASLMKWKPGVLADRVNALKLETIINEEPDPKDPRGAKIKVPHVKLEGDKTVSLADHAKATPGLADYLPALQTEPAKTAYERGSPSSNGNGPPRPAVIEKSGRPLSPLVR